MCVCVRACVCACMHVCTYTPCLCGFPFKLYKCFPSSHETQIGALQTKQQEILDDIAQFKELALVSFIDDTSYLNVYALFK